VVALLPRETAFATGRVQGDVEKATDLPELISRTAGTVMWQTPLVAIACAAVWFLLPNDWAPLAGPLIIVLVTFVALFPARIFQATLEGLQDLAFLGYISTLRWIVTTALTVALVINGYGLLALAWGWTAGQITSTVAWRSRLKIKFPTALPSRTTLRTPSEAGRDIARGGWISVAQVAQVFLTGTELLIIGKVLGPASVVPFFCTAKLITVLNNQPQLFMQMAGPGLSEIRAGENREDIYRVSTALTHAMLLASGAIVCVVLVVNAGFVNWWVGQDRYSGNVLTAVLLAAMFLRHWSTTAVYTIFAFGRDRRISLTTLFDGIVTIAVSIFLVIRIGPLGAAIGSLVGVCVVSLPGNLSAMISETGTSLSRMLKDLMPLAWRLALSFAAARALSTYWSPATVPELIAASLLIAAAYGILMFPIAVTKQLGVYTRPFLAGTPLEPLAAFVEKRS